MNTYPSIDQLKAISASGNYRIAPVAYEMLSDIRTPIEVMRILKNVSSRIMGKKDIIKIDEDIDLDFGVLAFISPNATVNIIRDEKLVEKKEIDLPLTLTDIIKCKNPRCITTTEQEIHHIFRLADVKKGVYRCVYCDTKYSG